jgi:phenylalanyl-tRNA synthetase alpha chain
VPSGASAEKLSPQERKVLLALLLLGRRGASPEALQETGIFDGMVEVMNGASWLSAKGLVTIRERIHRSFMLAQPGVASEGLPERRALRALQATGGRMAMEALAGAAGLDLGDLAFTLGWLRRKGWARLERAGTGNEVVLTAEGASAVDRPGQDEVLLKRLAEGGEVEEEQADPQAIKDLRSRPGLIKERERVVREIQMTDEGAALQGALVELIRGKYAIDLTASQDLAKDVNQVLQRMEGEEVGEVTPELLRSGRWRGVRFRSYDVEAFAPAAQGGKRHPMSWYLRKVRRTFVEMGFTEIRGDFVEPAFWAFDALFQPQDHPARDILDTFFVDGGAPHGLPDEDTLGRVAGMHEHGGDIGSEGWHYRWSREEAARTILRPHTTGWTLRYLAEHPDPPQKAFMVGTVFRRDAIDPTHLPVFHQIEGVVMEEGANLAMLGTLIREFYRKMGFPKVRVRPGYFPYTEPSLEPEIHFNGQWMEMGGSGIFRPEVTLPLGIRAPVLAWGLGLDRLVMAVEGFPDIRQLIWNDVDWLRRSRSIR